MLGWLLRSSVFSALRRWKGFRVGKKAKRTLALGGNSGDEVEQWAVTANPRRDAVAGPILPCGRFTTDANHKPVTMPGFNVAK